VGTTDVSLASMIMGREQLCSALDRAKDVSLYLLDRMASWME
jgi:hypothetical protein